MEKIKQYIPIILFIAAVIGWAYDSGKKAGKIETLKHEVEALKEDNKDLKDFVQQQIEFNGKVGYIVDRLSVDFN